MTMTLSGSGTITGLVAGGLPDASVVQADLASGIAGNGPAFIVYKNVDQTSISANVPTKITFQTKLFDTNNFFDNTTNYRFQPTIAGYYQINAGAVIPSAITNSYLQVDLVCSNSSYSKSSGTGFGFNATLYPRAEVSALIYFNGSTDYVEAYVYGSIGGAFSLLAGATQTWMSGCLIRSA